MSIDTQQREEQENTGADKVQCKRGDWDETFDVTEFIEMGSRRFTRWMSSTIEPKTKDRERFLLYKKRRVPADEIVSFDPHTEGRKFICDSVWGYKTCSKCRNEMEALHLTLSGKTLQSYMEEPGVDQRHPIDFVCYLLLPYRDHAVLAEGEKHFPGPFIEDWRFRNMKDIAKRHSPKTLHDRIANFFITTFEQ